MTLISPHGADTLRPVIVDAARRAKLESEAETLPTMMRELARCRCQCSDDGGGILHPPDRLHESG